MKPTDTSAVAGHAEEMAKVDGPCSSPKREKLDVESTEERQERLGRLFISKSPSTPTSPNDSANPFPTTRPEIGPLPQSDILARVRNFLPLMASSNETLLQQARENPESVDIENVKGDGRVIEMDLGLGVYDVKGQAGGDMGPELEIPESSHGEDEEEDDDEEEDEEDLAVENEDEDMGESSESSTESESDSSDEDEATGQPQVESAR